MWYNNRAILNRPYHVFLSATDRSILLHTVITATAEVEAFPPKDEVAQICTNENANDEVSVIVHSQQHNEVGHGKCAHVQCRSDRLLHNARSEFACCNGCRCSSSGCSCSGGSLSRAVIA